MKNVFPSEYSATIIELESREPDRWFTVPGAGSRAITVEIEPRDAPTWTAAFAGPEPGVRALTALLPTPSPTSLCVVERGTVYLGDVESPGTFKWLSLSEPVVDVEALLREEVLLLQTPWSIVGIDRNGFRWKTERIAVDGLRIDGACDGWANGVADPDDVEPRDFRLNLSTGDVIPAFGPDVCDRHV